MTEEGLRERKRSKAKKDRNSETAENRHDGVEPISKIEGSPEGPSSSAKVKTSKKRKRSGPDAVLDKPHKPKKRNKSREKNQISHPSYPDPADDESLSETSRRALSYTYERWRGIESWKFNKARQNWLLRNIWSEQAIPQSYVGLVIEYLASIKGGAKEKLVEECISKTSTSDEAPMQSVQPSEGSGENGSKVNDESTITERPGASRAQSLLHALHKNS